MTSKLLLCLLMIGYSLPALASETPLATTCSVDAAATQEVEGDADAVRGTDKRPGQAASKARPGARRTGDTESAVRPPRWHSFLPGMFR